MNPSDFSYSFISSQSPEAIYDLLLHIDQWWSGLYSETITGASEKPGDEFSFSAGGGLHYTVQKLVTQEPGRSVVWEVTDSNLSFLDEPSEWTGSRIGFDLEPSGSGTKVTFTHDGLTPELQCYDQCSSAWTGYMKQLQERLG